MLTKPVIVTAIVSAVGFLLNSTMFYLVLSRGRKTYHYLFSALLFICAIWDMGILLSMLRNSHERELIIYGHMVFIPCSFLYAIIFHFTASYLGRPKKTITIVLWLLGLYSVISLIAGFGGKFDDVFHYSWGNIYRPDRVLQNSALVAIPLGFITFLSCAYMLFQARKSETSRVRRRHMAYIAIGFIALTLATIKLLVLFGVDNAFILPAGMLVNDLFSALIAIAIIKHQLLDVTVIIKKGAIYSLLAGVVIFVFSFMEHVLITYMGELIGGHSQVVHFISVGAGILVLMPIKHRIEKVAEKYFAQKKLAF